MVTWLSVQYSEKDQAKTLGAKWSSAEKKWFVPDGVDVTAFHAWLPKPRAPLRSVPPTPFIPGDGIGPQIGTQTVALEILEDKCWKCEKPIQMVSGVILPPNVEAIKDWQAWWPQYYLALPLDRLADQKTLADAVATFRRNPEYELLTTVDDITFSAGTYFACSCPLCGAGQGSFPMEERRLDIFMTATHEGKISRVQYEPIQITITKEDLTDPPLEASAWTVDFPDDRVFFEITDDDEIPLRQTPKPSAFSRLHEEFKKLF